MATEEKKEPKTVGPNEDYLAETDIYVNATWTKTALAGESGADILFVRAGQAVAHESAVRLGLLKEKSAKTAPNK